MVPPPIKKPPSAPCPSARARRERPGFEVQPLRGFEAAAHEAAQDIGVAEPAAFAEAMFVADGARQLGAARHDRRVDPDRDGRVGQDIAVAALQVGGQHLIDFEIGADVDLPLALLAFAALRLAAGFGRRRRAARARIAGRGAGIAGELRRSARRGSREQQRGKRCPCTQGETGRHHAPPPWP